MICESLNSRKKTSQKKIPLTRAQSITMIANSEISKIGKIFSYPFLVCPAGFPAPAPGIFSEILFYCSGKGQGGRKQC